MSDGGYDPDFRYREPLHKPECECSLCWPSKPVNVRLALLDLEAKLKTLEMELDEQIAINHRIGDDIFTQNDKIKRAEEIIRFYGDRNNFCLADRFSTPIFKDGGQKAREYFDEGDFP